MDACLTDWQNEIDVEFPVALPPQRRHLGLDNELMELVWRNGEAVLHSQNTRKARSDSISGSKQVNKHYEDEDEDEEEEEEEEEEVPWMDCCPIDVSFQKEFSAADLLSEIPASESSSQKLYKLPSTTTGVFAAPPLPPQQHLGSSGKLVHEFAYKDNDATKRCSVAEPSVTTAMEGLSHHSSNQVADMSWGVSSCRIRSLDQSHHCHNGNETAMPENASFRGSGASQSNDSNRNKRKSRNVEESECPSDAPEFDSPGGRNSRNPQKSSRKTRIAEVHNQSERRRRDRINEKMRALQELIPHAHKSDKASMLDEAIEYMKSLQLQLQWLWMGSGMPQMMLPRALHYIYHSGMAMSSPMQSLMSGLPLVGQAMTHPPPGSIPNQGPGVVLSPFGYPNQMLPNGAFPEHYSGNMAFHFMPCAPPPSQAQANVPNSSSHSAQQQNRSAAQPDNNATVT